MKTQEYICIRGVATAKLIEAVQTFANLYPHIEATKRIELFKSEKEANLFIVNFSSRPDFERFKYSVNYLNYPDIDGYKAEVKGFWTIDTADGLPSQRNNQRVMLYVSKLDDEGDNVYATFEQESNAFKLGFTKKEAYQDLNKSDLKFKEPKLDASEFSLLKTISTDSSVKKKTSGKGCLLTLSMLIAVAAWLTFG